jgi:hypothetical protein
MKKRIRFIFEMNCSIVAVALRGDVDRWHRERCVRRPSRDDSLSRVRLVTFSAEPQAPALSERAEPEPRLERRPPLHVGPAPGSAIRDGVHLRRGALPRPPDRVQIAREFFDPQPMTLREFVLEQFTPAARRLAR